MKQTRLLILFVCIASFANSYAANRYWKAASSANWADATSWTDTSGGTADASAPTTGDDVFFESGSAITVTLGAAVTVNSITFTSRNVTFAGAFAITTTNMTVDNSQVVFVNTVNINSSLVFSGTSTIPRIKHMTTGNFQLGNGGAFTLTGNSATNYFEGTTSSSFRYNTTSALTVFFKANTTLAGIYVYNGLITIGNNLTTVRINMPNTSLNSQELIIGTNVTFTLTTGGTSGFASETNGGTVNASASGSKFVINSTSSTVLDGTKRIFKTGATINHFEFNSSGNTFNLFESIRVRNITKTAGTIATTASKTITVEAGGSIAGAGSIGTDIINETPTTRYWVGGSAGNWFNAANWGTSSGNTSTARIPAYADNVVFDNSAGNENPTVTLTDHVTAADITFNSSNVNFAGADSIKTNSMTVNSSQVQFVDHVKVNSSLTFSGTNPRITQQSTTSGRSFFFGNGGAFTLTGNSATNYFTGNTNAYYTFNTTSPLTVYFNPTTTTAGAIVVTKGLITLGNDIKTNRLTLNALNSQELILGENVTFTMLGGGTSNIVNTALAGVVNVSATGSKFVIASTAPTFLATAGRIFKDATTINHLEMNSSGQTFVPAYPLSVKNLTLTAGSINNTTNNITIPSGGNLVVGAGTTTAALNASLPSVPTSVVATAGDGQASVAFTAPVNGGSLISNYKYSTDGTNFVACSPAKTTSPIVITGLTNTNPYTIKLLAVNSVGDGAEGVASSAVTPDATANDIAVSTTTNISALSLTPVSDVVVAKDAELTVNQLSNINSLTVAAGGKVTNTSTLTTPVLTLNSNAADGTATYLDNGTSNITTLNANQYLGTTRNWYVSSPVVSTASSTSNIAAYYEYIEAGNNSGYASQAANSSLFWKGYTPGVTFMAAGKGYIALPNASSAAISFSGTMNTGDVSVSLSKAGTGFNLIGNPYPCHLTWTEAFATANTAKIYPTIWVRTNSGSSNAGGWSFNTHNALVGETVPEWANVVIAPMQAFWVKAKVDGQTLVLNSDLTKSHQANNRLKAPAAQKSDRQRVRLQVSNGTATDEALIYFDASASNNFDDYDSPKQDESASATQIYSKIGEEKLVINGMNSIVLDTPIPVGFVAGNATLFSLKANEISNIPVGVKVVLKDNATQAETDLTDGLATYDFSPATAPAERFSLIFRSAGVSTDIENTVKPNVQVFVNANNQISIIAPEKSNYAIYNSMGQLIENGVLNYKRHTVNYNLTQGVYIVKVNNQSTRVIIK